MSYNPQSLQDRQMLARNLELMFAGAGFLLEDTESGEDVYVRRLGERARIVVYSSIYKGAVRESGADAIRCMVLWTRTDKQIRSLLKETRVNRTGKIDAIVARTLGRMRDAYATIREREKAGMRCAKCGAPLFTSTKGNEVCVETCWVAK